MFAVCSARGNGETAASSIGMAAISPPSRAASSIPCSESPRSSAASPLTTLSMLKSDWPCRTRRKRRIGEQTTAAVGSSGEVASRTPRAVLEPTACSPDAFRSGARETSGDRPVLVPLRREEPARRGGSDGPDDDRRADERPEAFDVEAGDDRAREPEDEHRHEEPGDAERNERKGEGQEFEDGLDERAEEPEDERGADGGGRAVDAAEDPRRRSERKRVDDPADRKSLREGHGAIVVGWG